jgi:hypothetical protein
MKIKSFLAKPYAALVHSRTRKDAENALVQQEAILQYLLKQGSKTLFGAEHHFADLKTHAEFSQAVPVRDYEALSGYIEKIKAGQQNILWKGKPMYFAKTSGTTSGTKYIPISKDSIHNHIDTAKNALLCYMIESGNASFADGKMIFLSGSPVLERVAGIPTGRLSGIVNHFVPGYLKGNQLPSYETNCIEDWESKLGKIVEETITKDMRLISGIPPWIQMYFDWLLEKSGKESIKKLFPNLQVIVQGGVNFEPYKARMMQSLGEHVDMLETFPASEGFFAFQDTLDKEGLLLNTNSGIYFEFVPAGEIFNEKPTRLSLKDVKVGENYALIVNSNAGLWGYNIGDTIRFVSTDPYRIVVTGRTKHFISAFGEHVIGEEVEYAMLQAAKEHNAHIVEFTVAPMVQTNNELPYHEWFVEFEQQPADIEEFSKTIDGHLRSKNTYYDDLVKGNILQPLKIRPMQSHAFIEYMKTQGKLGGQNKVPRLGNDRRIADEIARWTAK